MFLNSEVFCFFDVTSGWGRVWWNLTTSTGSVQRLIGLSNRHVRLGGNTLTGTREFPSQCMEVLRTGGGCPFRQGFVPAWGRNAKLWEGVAVNGLCHPAKVRRGRRTHGREWMVGARGEGGLPYGYDVDRLNPSASGWVKVSVSTGLRPCLG